jgi:hypothetical protein
MNWKYEFIDITLILTLNDNTHIDTKLGNINFNNYSDVGSLSLLYGEQLLNICLFRSTSELIRMPMPGNTDEISIYISESF